MDLSHRSPSANRDAYKKHSETAAVVFKEYGALEFVECWGDDVPDGEVTSFPMAVKCRDDETWSSPGSFGLHAQSAIEAWKRSWPTHAYNPIRTRCPLTENA